MFYSGEKARDPAQQSQTKHGELSLIPTSTCLQGWLQTPQQLSDSSNGALTTSLGKLAQGSSFKCFPSCSATAPFLGVLQLPFLGHKF